MFAFVLLFVLALIFIIYKILICPSTPSNIHCDWQDAQVVITWDLQSNADSYQICYCKMDDTNVVWCTLSDIVTNRHCISIVNGIVYKIKIKAQNRFGTSLLASTQTGRSRALAPRDLNVSYSTSESNSIILNWSMVNNCDGYIIKRATYPENYSFGFLARFTDPTVTNFADHWFTFGIKYYYKIVSIDKAGESGQSTIAMIFPRAPPPSGLTVTYDEYFENFIKLQWTSVLNCEGYVVNRRKANSFFDNEQIPIKTRIHDCRITSVEDTSFIFGTTYYYTVASLDSAGESDQSNEYSVCPRAPAPSNLVVTYDEDTGTYISLKWSSVLNCDRYVVKKLQKTVRGMLVIDTFDVYFTTKLNDTSLTFGMTYYYFVVSIDQAGESKRSRQVTICPRAPSPKDVTSFYDREDSTSIVIQWKPVTNCKGYIVQRTTTTNIPNDKVTIIKTIDSFSITKTVDTSFIFGVRYTYTVVSLDQIGESGRSKPTSVCPRVPPVKDLTISFDDQTNSLINLRWKPIKNCQCYRVRRAENTSDSPYYTVAKIYSPSKTEITENRFSFGVKYYYMVESVDQAGASYQSQTVSILPRAPPPSNVVISLEMENRNDYSILLEWDPLNNVQGYIVRQKSDSSNETFGIIKRINNPFVNSTKIDHRWFIFGITYQYTVTSLDEANESDRSVEVSFCPRIPSPNDLTVTASNNLSGTIVLEWTPMSNSNGYCIYRAKTKDTVILSPIETITDPTISSYTDSNLQNDIDYWYSVASIDSAGVSSRSMTICGRAVLHSPTNLTAVVLHDQNAILLEWTCVSSACSYRIERQNNLNSFTIIGYVHDNNTNKFIDIDNVLADIGYSYKVYAFDETTESLPTSTSDVATVLYSKQRQKKTCSLNIKFGDLVNEEVDAIVVCSTSDELMKAILRISRIDAETLDRTQCIAIPSNNLPCRTLIFNPWRPDETSEHGIQRSLRLFILTTMQKAVELKCKSLAFPAIGCGRFNCDTKTVAEAMISETYHQFQIDISTIQRVSFIIEQQKQAVYDMFQQYHKLKQYFSENRLRSDRLPSYWAAKNTEYPIQFDIPMKSEEYQTISTEFVLSMSAEHTVNVTRIQRIQNKRLYRQHLIEKIHFEDILKQDTQRILYHGCANDKKIHQSIIEHGFDRSRAGTVHGTWYGYGVYFSSKATESHRYTKPHRTSRICTMFLCSVLLGKSTVGNQGTVICPQGYHSTTDNSSIYVIYRDAQAYANYLIYYKVLDS